MSERIVVNCSRRDLLRWGLGGGAGLLLGVSLPSFPRLAFGAPPEDPITPLNAFVRVGTDGSVTIIANHSEMGQGAYTTTAMLVAEELEPDWSKVSIEAAPVDPVYNHPGFKMQATGGSTSTWSEWERLRQVGASARQMLIAAAAAKWGVEPAACHAESGAVHHADSGRSLGYGELVAEAARQTPPEDVPLKEPAEWSIIGKPTARVDTPAKVAGAAEFGIDVDLPGMLVAMIARPPVFGATLKEFDASAASEVPGVHKVFAIDRGVAVVADGFWAAKKGRAALKLDWDLGPLAKLDSEQEGVAYAELATQPGVQARNDGDAPATLEQAGEAKLEAAYDVPYLAHSPMEPLNAVADVRKDGADVYVGTQFQTVDFFATVKATGLPPKSVKLHTTFLGGGFGRRGTFDSHFVREAVLCSKEVGAPVKVIWTREDDTRGGFYRPRAHHVIRGALDAQGLPAAWEHHVVCQSFAIGSPIETMVVQDGVDHTAVEGAADLPYAIPNLRVDWHRAPNGVPTHFWRSVGHSHNAFVVESFVDELAHAAGADPVEFRRKLLKDQPRHLKLLNLVAEKAGWGGKLPEGRARGVAIHEAFGSLVAQVLEVSLDGKRPRVHRVVSAIDCGGVVNPSGIQQQVHSAVVYGLTAALYGEISFKHGQVRQSNFHDYPLLRITEMPEIEVHLAPSGDTMGGVGEPGVPPVAPALANALFALTGKRLRRLPIRPADLG